MIPSAESQLLGACLHLRASQEWVDGVLSSRCQPLHSSQMIPSAESQLLGACLHLRASQEWVDGVLSSRCQPLHSLPMIPSAESQLLGVWSSLLRLLLILVGALELLKQVEKQLCFPPPPPLSQAVQVRVQSEGAPHPPLVAQILE